MLLALNAGSSSLKFALFPAERPAAPRLRGSVGGIGKPEGVLKIHRGSEAGGTGERVEAADHRTALRHVWERLERRGELESLRAAGHRIVHGGPALAEPCVVTPEVMAELHRVIPFAPAHLPPAIAIIESLRDARTELPQIACFDTEFHAALPRVARVLPLPRRFEARGIRRYGFHGLSYQFIRQELARLEPAVAEAGRAVFAHLGNGASLAAVRGGRCIDTSMALTPAAGVPMSTRTGDLDPGIFAVLARTEGIDADRFERMVTRESGLLGLSETSADLRELLALCHRDARAAEAVAIFCYQVKKWIGGFTAALGGLDTLVFTGGVGEHLAPVRAGICEGLEFIGVRLDSVRNEAHAPLISADDSRVRVRVIPTDEEQMIARAVCRVLDRQTR